MSHPSTQPAQPAPVSATAEDQEPEAPRGLFIRSALSTIVVLLLVPLIAILLTSYVFQSYQVDGVSMQNTLHNNDRLLVWKLPRTWARITGHHYVPKRGDIVIFTETGLLSLGDKQDTRQLVKRVIGLPGDRVVIKNQVITIYNGAHPDGFQPDKTLRYGANGAIPSTKDNEDVTLSADELFVCGDNRGNSLDSRAFGPIHTGQILGKLVLRILPASQITKF